MPVFGSRLPPSAARIASRRRDRRSTKVRAVAPSRNSGSRAPSQRHQDKEESWAFCKITIRSRLRNGSIRSKPSFSTQGSSARGFFLSKLREEARRNDAQLPFTATTPYLNTIPPEKEERPAWNRELEHKARAAIRWNAVAIILRANKESSELGGHIASFQSSALLYDVGLITSGMLLPRSTAAT